MLISKVKCQKSNIILSFAFCDLNLASITSASVSTDSRLYRDEIECSILSLLKYKSITSIIRLAPPTRKATVDEGIVNTFGNR